MIRSGQCLTDDVRSELFESVKYRLSLTKSTRSRNSTGGNNFLLFGQRRIV